MNANWVRHARREILWARTRSLPYFGGGCYLSVTISGQVFHHHCKPDDLMNDKPTILRRVQKFENGRKRGDLPVFTGIPA